MIVSSVLDHNGAAITFGLITAAAVLCSMVATAVAADVTRQLSEGRADGSGDAALADDRTRSPDEPALADEEQAALVEHLVTGLVEDGSEERAVRELVRQSVRLGRTMAAR
jgi:hypothetical protein